MKHISEKILLITDAPPCKKISGGSMTLQQVKFLLDEKHNVDLFLVSDPSIKLKVDSSIVDGVNIKQFAKPNERWEGDTNPEYMREISNLKKELHKMIKDNQYTKIWAIIQGEVILELVDYCCTKEKVDYVCQIWDGIEWWMKENGFSKKRTAKVMKQYYKVIKNASCCMTASWNMSKHLNSIVKANYIEVMPALELPSINMESFEKNDEVISISMAGQVYAKEELEAFFDALDILNWEINGKPVYFHHYGNYADIDTDKHKKYKNRIIREGFVNQKVLLSKLSTSDFLYCPYFFSEDETYKNIAITSFPSKLITYLAVPVPVIIHAPNYSSPYEFATKNKCGYLIDSNNSSEIAEIMQKFKFNKKQSIVNNAKKAFLNNFTYEVTKRKFFKALNIKERNDKRMKVLEVNNIDLAGRRFNGYDIMEEINNNTDDICKQIVTYKSSNNFNVSKFYDNNDELNVEYSLIAAEQEILSVHNVLSLTSNILKDKRVFKSADIVHYHLFHNTKLSLCQLEELVSLKPSVITLHDPWWFTGRCVHPEECQQWKKGCQNCKDLGTLFPLPYDNSSALWKLKESVYKNLDVDIIVATPFMTKCIKDCKMTNFKNVHVVPFGIDLDAFSPKFSQEEARRKLNINEETDIVIFLRAQRAHKGTEYVEEALKMLNTDKKITVLTCSETHLLDSLKEKFDILDLGNITNDKIQLAFNACDMFLMPSVGESFGLMAIEAMASSKPIIVFDNTALPYVTHAPECGVLVENKNSTKLMEAIQMLIENEEERIKRGNLGRKICEEEYDVKEYNKKIIDIYNKAILRQKNKKVLEQDLTVNYSKKDVQLLIPKLKKVYKRLGFRTSLEQCELFNQELIESENQECKINYADEDVKKVIVIFNNFIYSVYNEEIVANSEKKSNTERHGFNFIYKLKIRYYDRLKKHPWLFNFTRKCYNIARTLVRKLKYRKK